MTKEISHAKKSITTYSDKIATAWQKATQSILEVASYLHEAHNSLGTSGYRDLIRDLEDRNIMSRSTISKLSMIAKSAVLTNSEYLNQLPPSYETLYVLSRKDYKVLEEKIIHGEINAETQRKDIPIIFDQVAATTKNKKASNDRITITGDLKQIPKTQMQSLKILLKRISKSTAITISGISLD